MIDENSFKLGMRRLAGGVCIVATTHDGVPKGLVATAVTSLSSSPPSLVVCVNKSASAHDDIIEAGNFCVSVLDADDRELAGRFSRPELRETRFAGGRWRKMVTGAPALAGAAASFDCAIATQFPFGTHTIIVGEIQDVMLRDGQINPLIYLDGSYGAVARNIDPISVGFERGSRLTGQA